MIIRNLYILGARSKLIIICSIHGEFEQAPNDHVSDSNGCPSCKFDKIIGLKRHTKDKFISNAIKIHGNAYDYSKVNYINARTKVVLICKKHGEFEVVPDKHTNRGRGCPICSYNTSLGEIKISSLLVKNDIEFVTQKTFDDLYGKYNKKLKFDFYLPKHNILIEFDGEQHFKPITGMRSKIWTEDEAIYRFNELKYRDKLKNEYALKNKIRLIRVPYTANIEKIKNYYLYDIIMA